MSHEENKSDVSGQEHEWAVILAGGDGTRLKPLTRKIAGDERPKQFCRVLGKATLLEETQRRVALELAPERTLHVLNQIHKPYYKPLLRDQPSINLIVQPSNRGTAPAILYTLLRLAVADPNAVTAFFPSDHYISDDQKFMAYIRSALDTARARPDLVILLGLDPETPEVEYGWIEPGEAIPGQMKLLGVRRFWEKPNQFLAQALQVRGCLWNSFVMVASVQALLDLIASALAELYCSFVGISPLFGTRKEAQTIDRLYQQLNEINFSHQVLSIRPQRLGVIKVTGVRWNDLGEPKRVLTSLKVAGVRPHWLEAGIAQFA
jgi:mannose-1-phosphate guanylyltransferase